MKNTTDKTALNESEDYKDYGFSSNGGIPMPKVFQVPRTMANQIVGISYNLFDQAEPNTLSIIGLDKKINQRDFKAFRFATQNFIFAYLKLDTKNAVYNEELSKVIGKNCYNARISVTLNELCLYGYGHEPDHKERKAMETLISLLHIQPVEVTFSGGEVIETNLCLKKNKRKAHNGADIFELELNAIWLEGMLTNYGELPRNYIPILGKIVRGRGGRLTELHYDLLNLLCIQDKRKPYAIDIITLVGKLNIIDIYYKYRKRTEDDIITAIEDIKKTGLISGYEVRTGTKRGSKAITQIIFHFNSYKDSR